MATDFVLLSARLYLLMAPNIPHDLVCYYLNIVGVKI